MKRTVGSVALGLGACVYPLTQFATRRCGVRGAAVAEAACAGLAIRDASLVAFGLPGRLRTVPAALLRLELAAAVMASLAGLAPLLDTRSTGQAPATAGAVDAVRRTAVATLWPAIAIGGLTARPGGRQHQAVPGCALWEPR